MMFSNIHWHSFSKEMKDAKIIMSESARITKVYGVDHNNDKYSAYCLVVDNKIYPNNVHDIEKM
jgi:cytidylate kinase